jgi:uncharacterized protein YbjT (DUF2867 family)
MPSTSGYFGMKLATKRVVEQSGIGWTTLRATQRVDIRQVSAGQNEAFRATISERVP